MQSIYSALYVKIKFDSVKELKIMKMKKLIIMVFEFFVKMMNDKKQVITDKLIHNPIPDKMELPSSVLPPPPPMPNNFYKKELNTIKDAHVKKKMIFLDFSLILDEKIKILKMRITFE